ncbi:MAG: site-specific integrase [Magnetovibrio sp.]|nr:site-specific integrase [Magnetovibrio sp.]
MSRPRKPARIVRIPGKENWYVRDGREVYSTATSDEGAAQCFLSEYLAAKNAPKSPTVSALLDLRLDDLKASGKARAPQTPTFHNQLKIHFGPIRPERITPQFVKDYWQKRKSVPAALIEELYELRTTLRMALNCGWIDKAPHIAIPAKRPPRERFLTRDQARALFNAAKPMHLRLYLLIAMTTGARKGAILGLTWGRVDLTHGRLDFTDPDLAITKKRRTVVPVSGDVIAALSVALEYAQTGFVVEYMGKPLTNIRRSFSEAADKAGIPWATPHYLKHSVISWLAEDGYSVDKIADLTATHPNTVRRIYRKFSPDYLEDVAETLGKTLSLANQFAKPAKQAG